MAKIRAQYITISIYIERDQELELSVTGFWSPKIPESHRFGPPENYNHEVPETVEDISAATKDGKLFSLTKDEKILAVEKIKEVAREFLIEDRY